MMLSQAIGAADLILVDMYEIETCSTLPSGRLSYLNDFTNWDEFVARVPDVKKDVWWKHTFHREVPRTRNAYQRDLLRAARRAMKGGY